MHSPNTTDRVYDFIFKFIQDHHHSPSFEEIKAGLNLSTKSLVDYHLKALERQGRIQQYDGPRAIVIPSLKHIQILPPAVKEQIKLYNSY